MGDQIGVTVSGTLYYVPYKEFKRILKLEVNPIKKTSLFSAMCRINTLYMIARSGSGHIGSSFSSMDIMSWLQLNELRIPSENDTDSTRDVFFSSKGHDAPGLYSTFIGLGKLDFELIHKLRRIGGLPGHPDISTPNIITNTGSLGMGISKAKGMVTANRLKNRSGNIYVLTGDGELQEGQIWESLISAANNKMHEITVIVDHNKLQSDTLVSKVSDLGDLEAKFAAFGWHVSRCDGHDMKAFSDLLAVGKEIKDRPKVIIADTIKGKGVSFMQHTVIDSDIELYKFHSGAPTDDAYVRAVQELIDDVNDQLNLINTDILELETIVRPLALQIENQQRLIPAYSDALLDQAGKNSNIVALNADLILDTGLIPFQKQFPDRFIECGIAEQDMVSQAGGMALAGLLPVVHSFACFLSTRPNEQVYNNATEKTKIIYVGSLAGVLPGGPGHSHQAIRDIATMASIPGMIAMEPSCESEVKAMFDWCINVASGPCYLRLNSLPWLITYQKAPVQNVVLGCGQILRDGKSVAIISHGPAMLSSAIEAAEQVNTTTGVSIKVINLPWLNYVDLVWLKTELNGIENLITLEDHYSMGGQSDLIARVLSMSSIDNILHTNISVKGVPTGGTNAEVLAHEGLDSTYVANKIKQIISDGQVFEK